MRTVPVREIHRVDVDSRPQINHVALAETLSALFEDRASSVVIDHLKTMGQGNPKIAQTRKPIMAQMLGRVVDSLSILYVNPPSRRLVIDDAAVMDDEPLAVAFRGLLERGDYGEAMRWAEALRSLFGQVVVSFAEDHRAQAVRPHLYSPDRVYRMRGSDRASNSLEGDEWVLLQTAGPRYYGSLSNEDDLLRYDHGRYRFQAWQRVPGDEWRCWVCDGAGQILASESPYGESGETPFMVLPMVLVQDRPSQDSWLPIPESRVSFALTVNAGLNDLEYLITQEAHSRYVLKSDSMKPPTVSGPGETVHVQSDEDMDVLSASPKISEAISTLETLIQSWAVSEAIPVEALLRKRGDMTGDAIIAGERDLENRRQRKRSLAIKAERECFAKMLAVHNAFADEWGLDLFPWDASVSVQLGRAWQAKTPKEKQEMLFAEMAAGLASTIDYLQQMHGVSRDEAIEVYRQVQSDREAYPVMDAQPPGALIADGRRPALGEGSATREPGVFHPDIASSVEGASLVEAVKVSTTEENQ